MRFLWGAGADRGGIWEMAKGQGRGQLQRHLGQEIAGSSRQNPAGKSHGSIQPARSQLGPAPNWELRAPARTHGNIWEYLGIL